MSVSLQKVVAEEAVCRYGLTAECSFTCTSSVSVTSESDTKCSPAMTIMILFLLLGLAGGDTN
eukprot:1063586-Pleurochrysis_carterae.AAC.1